MRELGNFTRQLRQCAEKHNTAGTSMWIRVQGPYGGGVINFHRRPVTVMVAGGVGITPVIGILRSIYGLDDASDTTRMELISQKKTVDLWYDQSFMGIAGEHMAGDGTETETPRGSRCSSPVVVGSSTSSG